MSKVTTTPLTNLQSEQSAVNIINVNTQTLVSAIDNTLSRDGTSPNTMLANLDMNSNKIINLPIPSLSTEPVRKREFDQAVFGNIAGALNAVSYGVQTLAPSEQAQVRDNIGLGPLATASSISSVNDPFAVNGSITFAGILVPSVLGGNQADYAPPGIASASVVLLSSSVDVNVTGLVASTAGRTIWLHNTGNKAIVLKNDDGVTSTAANRFALVNDVTLSPNSVALIQYDGNAARWRVVAGGGGGGSTTGVFSFFKYTATGGQTVISGTDLTGASLVYTPANVMVFRNGVLLTKGSASTYDYTATDGSSITLNSACTVGDSLLILSWSMTSTAVAPSAAFSQYSYTAAGGTATFSGADLNGNTLAYTVNAIQVYKNGRLMMPYNGTDGDYTATNGTSIVFQTAPNTGDSIRVMTWNIVSQTNAVLTDAQSLSAGQKTQVTQNIGAVATVKVTKITANGNYTPSTGLLYAVIEALGGGGGGGGATSTGGNGYGGSGGGAGSLSKSVKTLAQIQADASWALGHVTVTIGLGGNANGAGGDTSVGSLCIGKGGGAGNSFASGSAPGPGTGGVAGTGDLTAPGANGSNGWYDVGSARSMSGNGASSAYGGGGSGQAAVLATINGGNATGYGAGGGGGATSNGGTATGGLGSGGIVVITEYCNQ